MKEQETQELGGHFQRGEQYVQRHENVKQPCFFGELKVFWHGWSTAACKQRWTQKTERCVGLDYEDLACSAKEVGQDTV